jgi:hypothetical protein
MITLAAAERFHRDGIQNRAAHSPRASQYFLKRRRIIQCGTGFAC